MNISLNNSSRKSKRILEKRGRSIYEYDLTQSPQKECKKKKQKKPAKPKTRKQFKMAFKPKLLVTDLEWNKPTKTISSSIFYHNASAVEDDYDADDNACVDMDDGNFESFNLNDISEVRPAISLTNSSGTLSTPVVSLCGITPNQQKNAPGASSTPIGSNNDQDEIDSCFGFDIEDDVAFSPVPSTKPVRDYKIADSEPFRFNPPKIKQINQFKHQALNVNNRVPFKEVLNIENGKQSSNTRTRKGNKKEKDLSKKISSNIENEKISKNIGNKNGNKKQKTLSKKSSNIENESVLNKKHTKQERKKKPVSSKENIKKTKITKFFKKDEKSLEKEKSKGEVDQFEKELNDWASSMNSLFDKIDATELTVDKSTN